MKKFAGFTEQETFTQIPDSFFRQLLSEISDPDEFKVTLHALWRFEHMEGRLRYLITDDFSECVPDPGEALAKAVKRGSLLRVDRKPNYAFYFLNSPRGRTAVEAYGKGELDIPNIFKLYEENIGPLTPLIADALKDSEQTYPPEWVAEALEIAVKNNKRNWKYVEAILHRFKEEGHAKEQDRRNVKELRGRDVTRKVEDFLKR
jgi:DNA replication protein